MKQYAAPPVGWREPPERILLTTADAALAVGVSVDTISKWVERGYLTPVNPGRKPSRFREFDVWQCARLRVDPATRGAMIRGWNAMLDNFASPDRPTT